MSKIQRTRKQEAFVQRLLPAMAGSVEVAMANRQIVVEAIEAGWLRAVGPRNWSKRDKPTCIVGLLRRLFGQILGSAGTQLLGLPRHSIGTLTNMNDGGRSEADMVKYLMAEPVVLWVK